ncbi:response regulator [Kiritimatiellaeota bacterium B1221]|nr:response regulator [Kiritimatiellaeota bacterium B1221]
MNTFTPSLRALLVEDNPADADLVIESAGFEVHRTVNFEVEEDLASALTAIQKNPPDIVLLDLGLPDSQGIPTFEKLHQAYPDIPVIVLTGNHDTNLAIKCIELGAQDFLAKGKTEHFISGAIHNTVARARTQRALNESRRNLQGMIEDSPDAILVLDKSHYVLFANEVASHLLGEQADIGQSIQIPLAENTLQEFEIRPPDSPPAIVEVRMGNTSWYGAPAYILTLTDITNRRQTEKEKERLLAAIEQIEDTVIVIHLDGTIEYVNPAFKKTSGYDPEDILGQSISQLFGDEEHPEMFAQLQETLKAGKVWRGRIEQKCKNGTSYTVESTISPVSGQDGKLINFVAVNRDITDHLRIQNEKNTLQEQLVQSQKLESVGRLAAGIAHDFNNMLSVILGYAQIIQCRIKKDTPLYNEVKHIEDAAQRSAVLTRQLLAFSRRQTLQMSATELNKIVLGIEPMLRRVIAENIELKFKLTSSTTRVIVDPAQMEQVIMNLVVNAKDAMPRGGIILIESKLIEVDKAYTKWQPDLPIGHYVQLVITDNGCGISPDLIENIFEPFFTTKEVGDGTGLGLSMVYGIIKQCEGSIQAYSEMGRGTAFKIFLPLSCEESLPEITTPTLLPPQSEKQYHILVVEDEKFIRNLMATLIPQMGHQVTVASSGREALRLIEDQKFIPDLLITDVVMPNMSGIDLIAQARKLIPNLKYLYMSGYTDHSIATHGTLEPGSPFIHKPFTLSELTTKVEELTSA